MASLVAPILLSACVEALMRSPLTVFDRTICIADIYETVRQPVLAKGQQQGAKGVAIIKGNLWHEGKVLLLWVGCKGTYQVVAPQKEDQTMLYWAVMLPLTTKLLLSTNAWVLSSHGIPID